MDGDNAHHLWQSSVFQAGVTMLPGNKAIWHHLHDNERTLLSKDHHRNIRGILSGIR